MKKVVNRIPPEILKQEIIIWPEDEEVGHKILTVEILKEDYVHDGDMASAPKSIMKESMTKEEWNDAVKDGDYYLIFPKGMRVIIIA
jgi:hypothetical protein